MSIHLVIKRVNMSLDNVGNKRLMSKWHIFSFGILFALLVVKNEER